jgi:hypothetical protein
MTLAESENSQAPYTTETLTQDTLGKTGALVRTGPAFHGRMLKETFLEILQHKTTTDGIRTLQRSQFQFLTKVLKTVTLHNKQTIQPQLKRLTITVLLLALSQ